MLWALCPDFPPSHNFVLSHVCICSPIKKCAKLFYVGSTEKSTMAREHARFRKYKQVIDDKLVSAELALKYWAAVPDQQILRRRHRAGG